MYTLLIVDDEEIIREGMVETFTINTPNFDIRQACNGLEALSIIEAEHIDAMVLDIKMPKLDGVALLKILKEKNKFIKTIVLSGYEEFEYAKVALEYGAYKYILKPTLPSDIEKIAKELEKILERERKQNIELENMKKQFEDNLGLVKEKFFNDLLNHRVNADIFSERADFLKLNLSGPYYKVAIIDIIKYYYFSTEEKKQIINFSVNKYFENKVSGIGDLEFFQINSNQYILVFNIKSLKEDDIRNKLHTIKRRIEFNFNVSVIVGIGNAYSSFLNIRKSYFEAYNAVRYSMLIHKEDIIDVSDIEGFSSNLEPMFDFEEFLIKLKLGEIDEIKIQVKDAFKSVENSVTQKIDLESFNIFCFKLVVYIFVGLKELNIDVKSIELNEIEVINDLYKCKSCNEIKEKVIYILGKVGVKIEECRKQRKRTIVEKVENLINQHYKDNISIKMIADILFVNPNYLGHLFRSEKGMSINDYLNRARVNKAKVLLKNSELLVYEIAEKVGFSDAQYFSTVFKKIVGVTPKEFKEI